MTEAVSEDLAEPHGAVETSVVDATPVANPPPLVSVIIPAFDEAENMPELFSELAETFRDHDLRAEVLLVDDGSRDKTYQYLVLFDADLQHSTEEIPRYVARLDAGDDLVSGYKVGPYKKRVVSGIYNRISRLIFRVPVRDLNSMKAFRREVLDAVHLRKDWHRYLVVLAHAEGYRLSEIDIELHPRRHGQPKYQGRTRIVIGALDLVAVWFQLVFSRKPMLFFGVTGVGLIGLGVLVGLVELYLRFGLGQGFRPLLTLVSLLITVGLLLLILGFLAELIAALRGEVEELRKEVRRHRD
jgi:glycosyltransferase involved in cell wall biosynthesis